MLRCLTWEYYDIMEQQGGRDFVLLEANGILEHLLTVHDQNTALASSSEWLDWEEHGGQFLHFTYLLERFIKNLISRSVQFRVVMFEQHDQLILTKEENSKAGTVDVTIVDGAHHQSPQYRLAKRLLHQHLTKHCDVQVDVFEGGWFRNEKWLQYLREYRPSFIVTSAKNAHLFTMYNSVTEEVSSVCDIEFVGNTIFAFTSRLKKEPSEVRDSVVQLMDDVVAAISLPSPSSSSDVINGPIVEDTVAFDGVSDRDQGRLQLTLDALVRVLGAETDALRCERKLQMAQLLLATQLIVGHVPLAFRAQKLRTRPVPEFNEFLGEFIENVITLIDSQKDITAQPDLYDILDGRLFYKLAQIFHQHYVSAGSTSLVMDLDMPEEIDSAWKLGRDALVNVASATIGDSVKQKQCDAAWWNKLISSHSSDDLLGDDDEFSLGKLIPMHSPLIDGILGEWNNTLPQITMREYENTVSREIDSMDCDDVSSWRPARLLDNVNRPLTERERKKVEETQKRLHAYGDSMSKLEEKKTIETGTLSRRAVAKPNAKRELMKAQNTKDQTLKKINDIRARYENIIGRRTREEREIMEMMARLEREIISKIEDVIDDFNRNWVQWSLFVKEKKWKPNDLAAIQGARSNVYDFAIQVQFTKLKLKMDRWLNYRPNDEERVYEVFEWINYVHDLCCRWEQERGTKSANDRKQDVDRYKEIVESLLRCGFDDYAKKVVDMHPDVKPYFAQMSAKPRNRLDPYKLQLKYNNNYLTVDNWFPKSETTREKMKRDQALFTLNFEPDPWQQQLIDYVKNKRSVLCSAPTSSGKTFIAFYVIEKVLRESNDGVVVFVLPTPALANQVYAEIYARFNKTYSTPNMHMLGMFSGFEKINVSNSQVLVTIPNALEMLMLSPGNNAWKRKLQYVILDEIHSIGAEGGEVWEHILALIECPFLALSATIGNPEEFRDWLNSNRGDVELVVHKERPIALEYQVYRPNTEISLTEELASDSNDDGDASKAGLVEVHPCAVLNAQRIDAREIENMPLFSSQQCLALFDAAQIVANRHQEVNLFADLQPSQALKPIGLLTQLEFSNYRRALKKRLELLANNPDHHARLLEIFGVLRSEVDDAYNQISTKYTNIEFDSEKYLLDHFVDLCMQLKHHNQLPSIMFHFDRFLIDQMLEKLVDYLKETNQHMWNSEVDRTAALTSISGIERDITGNVSELFVDALKLGIAVHYSAMHGDYLKEVERLFRSRAIPVLIATGTLALGVHMPCRTVAIIGKSIYLTTSLFNQCSGRAGRRNFDTKGKVVLYGISQVNMNRLMTGANPRINGSMGLSPSFIMRLMLLYNATVNSDRGREFENQVLNDCMRVLKQPLFSLGHLIDDVNQVKHYFRFLLEMMAREKYFDPQCNPMDWTNLVAGMFYQEPMNFVVTRMLRDGVFHRIMNQNELPYSTRLEQMMSILSYMYGRRTVSEDNDTCNVLADMPEHAKQSNERHNKLVLSVMSAYVRCFAQSFPDHVQDCVLPLSGIAFVYQPPDVSVLSRVSKSKGKAAMAIDSSKEHEADSDDELKWDLDEDDDDDELKWDLDEDEDEANEKEGTAQDKDAVDESSAEPIGEDNIEHVSKGLVVDTLQKDRFHFFAVSSFYALSGHGDSFDSLDRLLETLRHTILLDKSIVPTRALFRGRHNSYALDFFRHGLLENLRRNNDYATTNAARNDLEKMNRSLKSLFSSISNYMEPSRNDPVFHGLEELSALFNSKCRQRPLGFHDTLKFSIRHINEHVIMISQWLKTQPTTTTGDETDNEILTKLSEMYQLQEGAEMRQLRSDVSVTLHNVTQIMEIMPKRHPMYDRVSSVQGEVSSLDRLFKQGRGPRRPRDVRVEADDEEMYGLGSKAGRSSKDTWGDKADPDAAIDRERRR